MTQTLLLPGIDGSPDPHGQAWWQATDPTAVTVDQDDWANPSPEAWEAKVADAVLQHPGAILVAHSLGYLVVARLLAPKFRRTDHRGPCRGAPWSGSRSFSRGHGETRMALSLPTCARPVRQPMCSIPFIMSLIASETDVTPRSMRRGSFAACCRTASRMSLPCAPGLPWIARRPCFDPMVPFKLLGARRV